VEGSFAFRNPSEDMPADWTNERRRILHYEELGKPVDAPTFARSLRERLATALTDFNRALPRLSHVRTSRKLELLLGPNNLPRIEANVVHSVRPGKCRLRR